MTSTPSKVLQPDDVRRVEVQRFERAKDRRRAFVATTLYSQQQVVVYLAATGLGDETYNDWFPGNAHAAQSISQTSAYSGLIEKTQAVSDDLLGNT